jgi:hypothetical protein
MKEGKGRNLIEMAHLRANPNLPISFFHYVLLGIPKDKAIFHYLFSQALSWPANTETLGAGLGRRLMFHYFNTFGSGPQVCGMS